MSVIKCKMCGGDLYILEDASVCECEYCGTKQTVPKVDDEKKLKLFERANRLRTACEFDKAAGVYESIVADFDQEAEAYWGLILCKFGIEYVDDPATGNKVPTCHRSSFDSLMDDPNYDMVLECADPIARRVYREEAKQIEELRKRIIEVSSREEPYDVFISYKELDDAGQRTLDSVIAQDVYTELTERGYRTFFSRISLEDKLGVEYEPYIFAALNSAKVMLVVGTDYDYFNAVWVKNEWSRFLALIAAGQKKTLIPVFKGIDAYDMPKEFRKLAAQDMGKVGAMQDLMRGVEKLLGKKGQETAQAQQIVQQTVVQGGGPNVTALLKRGDMALEDGQWDKAREFFDQVLNMDAECGEAYLGLAMAEARTKDRDAYAASYTEDESMVRYSKNAARARKYSEKLNVWYRDLDEAARIAWEKAEEEDRIAREKAEKEDRIAREKAEEEARIAREKAEKEAKIAREKARERLPPVRAKLSPAANLISAGCYHTVGLCVDGSVVAAGKNDKGQREVSGWSDIVAVAAGFRHTVGLRADGTVVAVGWNDDGQCGVSDWSDIVAVAAGGYHTVGLRADGTVVAVGRNSNGRCEVSDWSDIVAVAAGDNHTVGLRANGSVVAVGKKDNGLCEVSGWSDIVAVAAKGGYTVGLRDDGSVVAVGKNDNGLCEVSGWSDIVAVAAGEYHTVGLRADGSVVAVGHNSFGQCEVSGWSDIVAVAAGDYHTVGLRADGSVIAVGWNEYDRCDVSHWKLFDSLETIEAERKAAAAEHKERIRKLSEEKAALQKELANLRGLFSGGKRKTLEARLAKLDAELKTLN